MEINPNIKYLNLYSLDTGAHNKTVDEDGDIIIDNTLCNEELLQCKLNVLYNELDKLFDFGEVVGLDIETTGTRFLEDKALLVSITIKGITFVINVYDWTEVSHNYILARLTKMLMQLDHKYNPIWAGHNLTFDLRFIYYAYFSLYKKVHQFEFVYCTLIAELKLYQGLDKSNTLAALYSLRLGIDISKEIRDTFHSKHTVEKIVNYNKFDASVEQLEYASIDTIGLAKIVELQISNMEEIGMVDHVLNVEMAVINPITEAELLGIRHDTVAWSKVAETNQTELNAAEEAIMEVLSHFNLSKETINPKYFETLDRYRNQVNKIKERLAKLNYEIATTKNKETKKYKNFFISKETNEQKLVEYQQKIIDHQLEPVINWSSSQQIIQTMIEIGMEEVDQMVSIKKGRETKYSVAEDARSQWMINNKDSKYYSFVKCIDDYKKILSLIDKYGMGWANKFVRENGRVYTEYRQMGTVTGRLASGKSKLNLPNMQQIPRGVEYRECFISDEGKLFMTIDWSSAELCLIIGVSEDKNLLRAFKEGGDAHGYVGTLCWREVFKHRAKLEKDPVKKAELEDKAINLIVSKKENKDLRTKFKNVHFGVLYGAHITKIAQTMELNTEEAAIVVETIQKFENKAYEFLKKSAEFTMLNGYTVCHSAINTIKFSPPAIEYLYEKGYLTPEGKAYLKELQENEALSTEKDKFLANMMNDIRKSNFMSAIELDTKTRNLPIQGSQAEALKIYLADYRLMKRKYHLDQLEFNLTVHDEVVHQFPEYYQHFVPNIIYETMCKAPAPFLNGILDIEADYHIGTSWEK